MWTALLVLAGIAGDGEPDRTVARPPIEKVGTIECDIVEATPIVFDHRLLYFQSVRPDYGHKAPGVTDCYFRFWDPEKNLATTPFATGFHLGSAIVVGDTMNVFGVRQWGGPRIDLFWSSDLEEWKSTPVLDLPGWGIFNTSVCRAADRYIMAFEINKPDEETGVAFTTRFAESPDLRQWKLLPSECVYSRDRYTACPSIRYLDGTFYMTYLEARPGPTYETHIVRSSDLVHWESSPLNPVLHYGEEDKRIASSRLTPAERTRIAEAKNINNSDFDFCEHDGKTVILYSWGNQQGVEHLAAANSPLPLDKWLTRWFPKVK